MSFEVNTGTVTTALDGTEKIPLSQGGGPKAVQTRRFAYFDGSAMRSEFTMRIDTGLASSSLICGDPSGQFAQFNYNPGADFLLIEATNGQISASGNTYFGWSTSGAVIGTIDNATFKNSGALRILDTNDSHTLRIAVGSDLTANRTLTLTTGNANRTLDISAGNVTISAAGAALIDDADAAAQRSTLGLGTIATQNSNSVTITGGSTTGLNAVSALEHYVGFSFAILAKVDAGDGSFGGGYNLDWAATGATHSALGSAAGYSFSNDGKVKFYGAASQAAGTALTPIATFSPSGLDVNGIVKAKSYTVSGLPSAATVGAGSMAYVSDESGGAVLAFSDGSNWRRVTDRAVVS